MSQYSENRKFTDKEITFTSKGNRRTAPTLRQTGRRVELDQRVGLVAVA